MKIMKRFVPLLLLLCLALTACGGEELDRAALGWEKSWTAVGNVAAVEEVEGFTPNENLDAMSASGLWYATWTNGDAEVQENDEGQRAELYDAEIYLLIQKLENPAKAQAEVASWKSREQENYGCGEIETAEYAGVNFERIPLLSASETNPYSHGAAAFGVSGAYGISVELLCREPFDADPSQTLDTFLSALHLNLEEAN